MHGQGATDRMRDYERLREHASRLLALSHKAREEGRHELATELATTQSDNVEIGDVFPDPIPPCQFGVLSILVGDRLPSVVAEPLQSGIWAISADAESCEEIAAHR